MTDVLSLPLRAVTHDVAETEALGARLGAALAAGGVVLLHGDLGVGKTVLVRGLAQALGIARQDVQSPSYALIHEHEGPGGPLIHVDLYRVQPEEVASLGLDEVLAGDGIKAVEWPDRLPVQPESAVHVTLRATQDGRREIDITTAAWPSTN